MDHFAGLDVSVKETSILTVRGSSLASRKQKPTTGHDKGDKGQSGCGVQGYRPNFFANSSKAAVSWSGFLPSCW
jgi:hypothetical protein